MPRVFPILAIVALLLQTGCKTYSLGPTNGEIAGARSIQINPFLNHTTEPRLATTVTSSIRKRLQQDGTYRLDSKNSGDIIVTGTLIDYRRSLLSSRPDDIRTPRDYRVILTAHVKAVERDSGKTLIDREVTGRTTLRVGPDLTRTEQQALPLMAEDIARKTTSLLVEGTW